jgi:nucleoid-associated protein YgaU
MSRYRFTKINKSKTDINRPKSHSKYGTTIYQSVTERNDDIFAIATEGDRCDLLAQQFYGDQSLWWYIANANNLSTMNIPAGTSLRIPNNIEFATGD